MSKTGPIGQVEAFYIEHHYKTMTAQELADVLDRKVSTIKTHIKKNFNTNVAAVRAGDHFARNRGAVVMTETASMLSDGIKKSKKNHEDCVTKIKHD